MHKFVFLTLGDTQNKCIQYTLSGVFFFLVTRRILFLNEKKNWVFYVKWCGESDFVVTSVGYE